MSGGFVHSLTSAVCCLVLAALRLLLDVGRGWLEATTQHDSFTVCCRAQSHATTCPPSINTLVLILLSHQTKCVKTHSCTPHTHTHTHTQTHQTVVANCEHWWKVLLKFENGWGQVVVGVCFGARVVLLFWFAVVCPVHSPLFSHPVCLLLLLFHKKQAINHAP